MNKKFALMLALIALSSLICMCAQPKVPKKKVNATPNINTLKVFTTVLKKENKWCAIVTVKLPTPCYKMSYMGMNKSGDNIILNFVCKKTGEICTQVITKYNKTVCLGELPKGNYTVYVNINGKVKNKVKFKV